MSIRFEHFRSLVRSIVGTNLRLKNQQYSKSISWFINEFLLLILFSADVCASCLTERIRQEEEGKFIFSAQTVYVRKVADGKAFYGKGDDDPKSRGYNYDPEFSAPVSSTDSMNRTIFLYLNLLILATFFPKL